jgi:DNA-directed RNA polymerase sigma subunit (sigma70/sigma32)
MLDFDDLMQAGNLGIIRAIELYEPEKGFLFSTYASNWVKSK